VEKADVIVSLDADFLEARTTTLDQNLGFANRREPEHRAGMNRLYVVEPRFSITGGMADHRLKLRSADMEGFALALAAELGKTVSGLGGYATLPASPRRRVRGGGGQGPRGQARRGMVIPGEQTALTHGVAHAIARPRRRLRPHLHRARGAGHRPGPLELAVAGGRAPGRQVDTLDGLEPGVHRPR
jgi:molybdopterin-containing oxidoreductase family iron-sulfur binding subunit